MRSLEGLRVDWMAITYVSAGKKRTESELGKTSAGRQPSRAPSGPELHVIDAAWGIENIVSMVHNPAESAGFRRILGAAATNTAL